MIDPTDLQFIWACCLGFVVLLGIEYFKELGGLLVRFKRAMVILFGRFLKNVGLRLYSWGKQLAGCSKTEEPRNIDEFEVIGYSRPLSPYPPFLTECIRNIEILNDQHFRKEEEAMSANWRLSDDDIRFLNITTRESGCKSNFTYLLIDPRKTELIHLAHTMQEKFQIFIYGIFYVGKGSRSRPTQHIYQAYHRYSEGAPALNRKQERIHGLWNAGRGPTILQVFNNTMLNESYTREAHMICALGINNLLNEKLGDFYGESEHWSELRKQQLGCFLLLGCLKVFLVEGSREVKPSDLKNETKRNKEQIRR